jgi:hypothetical protein
MTDANEKNGSGLTEGRPARSELYPWYDSVWLTKYARAKAIIRALRPAALAVFIDAFRILRTRTDFELRLLEKPFDDDTMGEIRRVVASLRPTDLELHEARGFGRFVVHDHAFFTELHQRTLSLVSEAIGEPVEPTYNFPSPYTGMGVCPVHLDASEAKWTLDLCVAQSAPWPIYFSQVPWPDSEAEDWQDENWPEKVKQSASLDFTLCALEPGQAVVFSGSSQWHHRDLIPEANPRQSSTLRFLHFIPSGTAELIGPNNWARLFCIPELSQLCEGIV